MATPHQDFSRPLVLRLRDLAAEHGNDSPQGIKWALLADEAEHPAYWSSVAALHVEHVVRAARDFANLASLANALAGFPPTEVEIVLTHLIPVNERAVADLRLARELLLGDDRQ